MGATLLDSFLLSILDVNLDFALRHVIWPRYECHVCVVPYHPLKDFIAIQLLALPQSIGHFSAYLSRVEKSLILPEVLSMQRVCSVEESHVELAKLCHGPRVGELPLDPSPLVIIELEVTSVKHL